MKRCMILTLLLACGVPASAQSPEVWRKLRSRYDVVYPYVDDGTIMVNRGGQRIAIGVGPNGRYGYVDTLGQVLIPPTYDYATRFHNGFAVVGNAGAQGAIDRTGRVVVPCEWLRLGRFEAGVFVGEREVGGVPRLSLVDTAGRATPLDCDFCAREFSCGYARVGVGSYAVGDTPLPAGMNAGMKKMQSKKFSGKYGYIAPDGRVVIPVQFDDALDFDEDGLARVGMQGKYYVKWGFIDRSGRTVIPCSYYSADVFRRGRALVGKVVAGGKLAFGYIDREGREVIPCQYDEATAFKHPNTWVGRNRDGEMAYSLIDRQGNSVLEYEVYRLQDGGKYGHAVAARPDASGVLRFGIIGISGKILVPFEYDMITIFTDLDPETGQPQARALAVQNGVEYPVTLSRL